MNNDFPNHYGWLDNSVLMCHKNWSDYLEKELIVENAKIKFIISTGEDLVSSESECEEDNSGSDGVEEICDSN